MGSQRTSSTTVSTLITDVRYLINEPLDTAGEDSDAFWKDDEDLLKYINDGCRDIAARTGCLEETEDIDLDADVVEYSITSTTYTVVQEVLYTDSSGAKKGLVRGTPTKVGNVIDVSEPTFWYEYNGKIGVYPAIPLTSIAEQMSTDSLLDRDLDDWSTSGSPTLTQNATGIDGVASMAWTVRDGSTSALAYIYEAYTIADDSSTHVFAVPIKKDSDETRYPGIQIYYSGGTSELQARLCVNTKTGSSYDYGTAGSGYTVDVVDMGTWWLCWVALPNNGTGNTTATCSAFPAKRSTDLTSTETEVAAIGSAIFDSPTFEQNRATPSYLLTETVTLYMTTLPAALTATTDTIPTPAHYDVALKYYVAAQAFLKDRQISRYDGLMNLYYKILDRYRADFNEQTKESEDAVK